MGFIWSEARSVAANVAILGVIIMIGAFTVLLIGGLYGILWHWIAEQLGYKNLTVDQALKMFGNPSEMLRWFNTWWVWFWEQVNNFAKYVWDLLKGLGG